MRKLILFTVVSIVTVGCLKKDMDLDKLKGAGWTPSLAIPLVDQQFTVKDIIAKEEPGTFQVGADNIIRVIYKDKAESVRANEFAELPDQNTEAIPVLLTPAEIVTVNGGGTVNKTVSTTVDFLGAGLDVTRLLFKNGILRPQINNQFQSPVTVRILLPEWKLGANPFDHTDPVGANQTGGGSYDLTNYNADMTNGGSSFNKIPVQLDFSITGNGSNSSITDTCLVSFSLSQMAFRTLRGDMGQKVIQFPDDSLSIKLFGNALGTGGNVNFTNPKITLDFENSFGIPFDMSIDNMYTRRVSDNKITNVSIIPGDNKGDVPAAANPGQFGKGSLVLDNTNTVGGDGFTRVIEPTPKFLIYNASAVANPNSPTGNNNFLQDTSEIKVNYTLELPFDGFASDVLFQDTTSINVGAEFPEEFLAAQLKTAITNGVAAEITVELLFGDTASDSTYFAVIPSKQPVVAPANTRNGVVSETVYTEAFVDITRENLKEIFRSNRLITRAITQTPNAAGQQQISVLADDALDVKIGLKVDLETTIETEN